LGGAQRGQATAAQEKDLTRIGGATLASIAAFSSNFFMIALIAI
jgi:hypothetical protein